VSRLKWVPKIFEAAGIPRAQRSIERYCQQGDLDCLPDAIERRQYITRESVDTLIDQLKELAARHQKAAGEEMSPTADDMERRGATPTTSESVKHGTPEKQSEKHAIGEYEERLAAQEALIKELQDKNFKLEIDKSARDQVLDMMREQMTVQTKEFSGIHAKRDKLPSIAYSEELIFSRSATLQSTDRHHGIRGQERCHFPLDS
jgi:hypothetical protein